MIGNAPILATKKGKTIGHNSYGASDTESSPILVKKRQNFGQNYSVVSDRKYSDFGSKRQKNCPKFLCSSGVESAPILAPKKANDLGRHKIFYFGIQFFQI